MKRRLGPLLSVVLLIALGGWVYFREVRPGGAGAEGGGGEERALPFERSDVKAIRVTNEHGAVRLEKAGDAWTITEPLRADADKEAIEGLLSSLEIARIERRLGGEGDLKGYGLDPPKATLSLEPVAGGEPKAIGVGESNPIGGTLFALLPGGREVAVVGSSLGEATGKDLLALRDKSLLAFDPWKVVKLRLERGRETVRLAKPDDGWKLEEPVEAPADGPAVTDLLGALERIRAKAFVSEKPARADLRRFGLDPPAARLTLLQEGWDVEKTVVFGGKVEGGRYARTVGRDPVVLVPDDFWDKVTTRVRDLRRKDLVGVGQYRVEKVTAARNGKQALVLSRQKDQGWTASGLAAGTVKNESVDTLLRLLAGLKALSFEDRPSEALRASLARTPALDLTLQEEADADGKAGKSQHLVIGPPDRARRARARDMAWRPIASVAADGLAEIDKQLEAIVKEASEPKPEPSPSPGAAPTPTPSPSP